MLRVPFLAALAALAIHGGTPAGDGAWLDRPLVGWNAPGAEVPRPGEPVRLSGDQGPLVAPGVMGVETSAAIRARCRLEAPATTAARALEAAGWVAYDHLDRALADRDVRIVAGMHAADSTCGPLTFQLFVFVGDRFAGTLSPHVMTARRDGSAGPVRLTGADTLTAEFMRFGPGDATCCPTARMVVRYRVDRAGLLPVVVAESVRTSRSY